MIDFHWSILLLFCRIRVNMMEAMICQLRVDHSRNLKIILNWAVIFVIFNKFLFAA